MGAQLHHRLDLQLKHLQVGHLIAVMAWAQVFQLLGVEQGVHHSLLIFEVTGQAACLVGDVKLQLLTGAESQGHCLLAGAA